MAFDKFPFPKDPSEKLSYTRDFSGLIGDEVASLPTATCEDTDLEIENVVLSDNAVTCIISGGVAGSDYQIVFGLTFGDAELNYERTVVLKVRDR